jgi:hypothetical protein
MRKGLAGLVAKYGKGQNRACPIIPVFVID